MHAIVANGFAEGPAQALRDYFVAHGADVVSVLHPLTAEQGTAHVVERYEGGRLAESRRVDLRLHPPASYALDSFVPLRLPTVDAWFGFNPLAAARGLALRRLGRVRRVVLWSVDFVPDRFGQGTLQTRLYDRLDRLCCLRANARVELSEAARTARDRRHGMSGGAPTQVVPMGAWLARVPKAPVDGYRSRRVAFLGHLVERQGVQVLLHALARLDDVAGDVIGGGPLEQPLRRLADDLGVADRVRFHGFVADHGDVECLLADAAIGVAPYRSSEGTFTRYADPGKLKAYLAAGLPVVLTPVPPNAHALASRAGAELVDDDPVALAAAVARLLDDPTAWRGRRQAALEYVKKFDWEVLLSGLLEQLPLSG